jgi:GT2 family glycosyltransferase
MAIPASPVIDVIVPVYNQRELVESCLTSVLSARNRTAFEIVVVDDASTDLELKAHLVLLAETGRVTLLTNPENLGFTRSVNRGMRLHPERDVVLLNSDTLVSGDWIDRLQRAALSDPMVGTANPLTNASHIGSYPFRVIVGDVAFEISDEELDALAAKANRGRYVAVHLTVGFCMYIRRAVLDAVGYFDDELFPVGYGEESDFCYRARKLGWCHIVTGDVFVRHWEGQSFGERKSRLVVQMMDVFIRLHPEIQTNDAEFRRRDPIRPLREALDLARFKLLLTGATALPCIIRNGGAEEVRERGSALVVDVPAGEGQILVPGIETLASLPTHALPADIAAFNTMLATLGIRNLTFDDGAAIECFAKLLRGRPMDVGLQAALALSSDPE